MKVSKSQHIRYGSSNVTAPIFHMRLCVKNNLVARGVFCHVCHSGAVIENPCMSFENDIQDIHGSYAPVKKKSVMSNDVIAAKLRKFI